MMKKKTTVLSGLALTCTMVLSMIGFAQTSQPITGFQGYRWNDEYETVKEDKVSSEMTEGKDYYVISLDGPAQFGASRINGLVTGAENVDGISAEYVSYVFDDNKLVSGIAEGVAEGYDDCLKNFTALYGEPQIIIRNAQSDLGPLRFEEVPVWIDRNRSLVFLLSVEDFSDTVSVFYVNHDASLLDMISSRWADMFDLNLAELIQRYDQDEKETIVCMVDKRDELIGSWTLSVPDKEAFAGKNTLTGQAYGAVTFREDGTYTIDDKNGTWRVASEGKTLELKDGSGSRFEYGFFISGSQLYTTTDGDETAVFAK